MTDSRYVDPVTLHKLKGAHRLSWRRFIQALMPGSETRRQPVFDLRIDKHVWSEFGTHRKLTRAEKKAMRRARTAARVAEQSMPPEPVFDPIEALNREMGWTP